ncbi:MAG: thioredoxin domain-containing protein [Acidobacteriaceae bacterium]|nr:thioredoxin domain-containing protein [Acidobacteriaceae bacterium]
MPTNALIDEKSPYLQQHANNPVDWLPWGEAAFQKARNEDKPIFLSIGYSTCHWCHVMAHESFEDAGVAGILNRHFVPVKVDREERPDVDRVYMLFVQASTGSGGWPMSVFLTPDLKPFFGGTYFPPDSRYGRPGFRELLEYLARAWKQERQRIESSGDSVTEQLRAMAASSRSALEPDKDLFTSAFPYFRRTFDSHYGGFGQAPKFPRPVVFNYLLSLYVADKNSEALEMSLQTLQAMAKGGMYDQVGGGFHRYSVDERWFVPHFEKMLYDQAQLAVSYLEAFQITRDDNFARIARDIFRYVARDLTSPEGAFYSAEDADSPDPEHPGHSGEGAFYIWRKSEIESVLGEKDAALFCRRYGVEPDGNVANDPHGEFTGRNILYQALSTEECAGRMGLSIEEASEILDRSKRKLFEARAGRPRPHLDNKVLTSWNALMISALAKGYIILGDSTFLSAAEAAADFLLHTMYDERTGRLLRRLCGGEAAIPAFLDDYAFLAQALLDLFEAGGQARYLAIADRLARAGFGQFEDTDGGGFFSTAEHAPDVLLRIKDDYDGAEPSGNSVATDVLLRLAHLLGSGGQFLARADKSLRAFAPKIKAQPPIAPQMLVAVGRSLAEPEQIVVRCAALNSEAQQVLAEERKRFAPYAVFLPLTDAAAEELRQVAPFLAGLERKGRITVYRCRNFACDLPNVIQ